MASYLYPCACPVLRSGSTGTATKSSSHIPFRSTTVIKQHQVSIHCTRTQPFIKSFAQRTTPCPHRLQTGGSIRHSSRSFGLRQQHSYYPSDLKRGVDRRSGLRGTFSNQIISENVRGWSIEAHSEEQMMSSSRDAEMSTSEAEGLVDSVLDQIQDSDFGQALTPAQKRVIDEELVELEAAGETQAPLEDPKLFGTYEVSYVSSGPSQQGNPAGGQFRGALGRLLFRTTTLQQNLYEPDIVVNKVGFYLLGFIPGEVTLKGIVKPVNDDKSTVSARFLPPRLNIAKFLKLSIGPKSEVVLKTTYLDERVRLGKGSRGSLFVFKRIDAEEAERASIAKQQWGMSGWINALVFAAAFVAGAYHAYMQFGAAPLAVPAAILVGVLLVVLRNGGIVQDDPAPLKGAAAWT